MGDYAIALGDNAISVNPSSIALGHLSKTANPVSIDGMDINGTHYDFAGVANEKYGVVSIGRESERDETHGDVEGIKRQLINLAAGRVSDDSTDGINGSQLNAVIKELSKLNTELTTLKNAPKVKTPVIKAGDGLSLTEGDDGSITLSNALTFNAGNGITVNKTGNNVTITNSKPFEDADKEKLNTALTNASSALEKANTNEGAINTANGRINDLTSRVTANEGKITDLTGKVTTVTNTANEALGKAETALQPESLVAGNGVNVNNAGGKVTITNTGVIEIQAGDGVGVQNNNGVVTVSNTKPDLSFEGKDGITVDKQGNNVVISATGLAPKGTGVNNVEGANGISVTKEGDKFLITNTKPFEDADKEKLNSAFSSANSALEKANTNEGAISIANGKITANEGKITTQEGKVNDLTSRVTANEGNITTLTDKVTTVTNTANEALGKANTAVQPDKLKAGNGISVSKTDNGDITIENTKAFEDADKEKLNTAFDKSNTAVQPNDLTAGKGITINKGQDGINISTNITGGKGISIVESNNGLTINNLMEIKAGKGVKIDSDGNTYTISSTGSALPRFEIRGDDKVIHEVVGALNVAGDENIETATEGGKVTVKLKKDIDVNSVKSGDNTFGKGGLKVGNTLITAKGAYMGNQVVDGVADGEIAPNSKQAINGGQLAPVVERILDHERAITQLDGKVGYLDQRITRMDKKHNAGIAGVAAMVGIPQVMEAGGVVFGAGVGNHAGANAVAVGASMASDNGRHMIKTSFSVNSQKQVTSSIGYGFKWK